MNKTLKKVLTILIPTLLLLIIILIGTIVYYKHINNIGNDSYYKIDDDKIISITSVVGKREINSISTKKSKGIITKKYEYKNVKNVKSDINSYIEELKNSNYINTTDINLSKDNNVISFASYSAYDDDIIIISISYNLNSYEIIVKKGSGSIQPYN